MSLETQSQALEEQCRHYRKRAESLEKRLKDRSIIVAMLVVIAAVVLGVLHMTASPTETNLKQETAVLQNELAAFKDAVKKNEAKVKKLQSDLTDSKDVATRQKARLMQVQKELSILKDEQVLLTEHAMNLKQAKIQVATIADLKNEGSSYTVHFLLLSYVIGAFAFMHHTPSSITGAVWIRFGDSNRTCLIESLHCSRHNKSVSENASTGRENKIPMPNFNATHSTHTMELIKTLSFATLQVVLSIYQLVLADTKRGFLRPWKL